MEKIVFLDRKPIPAHIHFRSPNFAHQWQDYDSTELEQRFERLQDATIAISNKVILDAPLLAQLPKLKLIALTATGFNHIDIKYCHQQHIPVCNIRNYANQSVAEHVFAMIFSLRRRLNEYQNDIACGDWQNHKQFCFFNHPIQEIAGSTLTIIGGGSLGQATANMGKALGMQILFAERKNATRIRQGYTEFTAAIAAADVISLHCPFNATTDNLIDHAELKLMKPSAILINTARGGIVNEDALVEALIKGTIAGAGIDVCSQEPPSQDHPFMRHIGLPNLVLTPHVAWGSNTALQTLANQLIDNLEAFIAGKPQHLIEA